jgi:hypothetical protein
VQGNNAVQSFAAFHDLIRSSQEEVKRCDNLQKRWIVEDIPISALLKFRYNNAKHQGLSILYVPIEGMNEGGRGWQNQPPPPHRQNWFGRTEKKLQRGLPLPENPQKKVGPTTQTNLCKCWQSIAGVFPFLFPSDFSYFVNHSYSEWWRRRESNPCP